MGLAPSTRYVTVPPSDESTWPTPAAVPQSPAVREELARVLIEHGRFSEAEIEAGRLASQGYGAIASALRAQALLGQRRFREAGELIAETFFALPDDQILSSHQTFWGAGTALLAAGRAAEGLRAQRRVWDLWTTQRPVWDNTDGALIGLPKSVLGPAMDLTVLSQVSGDSTAIRTLAMEALDGLRAEFGNDQVGYGKYIGRFSAIIAAYLASRDTVVLSRWLREREPAMWRSPEAHLALQRGDTAQARQLLAQHFRPDEPIPAGPFATFRLNEDLPDAYAWADLLARLGELERAIQAYDRLDEAPYDVAFWTIGNHWGLLVRSYAHRGSLYQQLGNRDKAIEMYRRFVDAWAEGDETVQPMVDRARRALAALRGEAEPSRP